MAILGPKSCLGIDIGTRDIRVVEVRRAGGKLEIAQAARISVSENGDLAAALSEFLLDTETRPGQVAASLPTHLCSVKFAQVPKAKPADQARMVRFEAESQIPLPLGDVVWDYIAGGGSSEMSHVVIGGARRSDVDQTLGVLERAKLSPDALMVSAVAAVNRIRPSTQEPVLLVQIGTEWSDLCVLHGEEMLACRTVRLGGDDLSRAFAQDLGVDAEEAEETKLSRGLSQISSLSDDPGASAIENWAEKLALEVRRSIVAVPFREPDQRPQTVLLIGEAADVPGLVDDLSRRTGLQVEIGDPWRGLSVSRVVEHTLRENAAAFATATGLASACLDGKVAINLMPHHRAEERARRRNELVTLSALGGVAALLLLVLLGRSPGLGEKSAELSLLKTEATIAQREISRAGPDLRTSASNVTQIVQAIRDDETCPLEILRQMSTVLPRGIWLSEFAYESQKSVVLKGSALSNAAVADAVDMINQMALFKDVTLDFSNLTKNEQGYEFQITCYLPAGKSIGVRSKAVKPGSNGSGKTGIVVQ